MSYKRIMQLLWIALCLLSGGSSVIATTDAGHIPVPAVSPSRGKAVESHVHRASPEAASSLTSRSTDDCAEIMIEQKTLNQGIVGRQYSQPLKLQKSLNSGATPKGLTWSIVSGTLPMGLYLNPAYGQIDGIPVRSGSFAIGISVVDASGCKGYRNYTIRIINRPYRPQNDELPASFVSDNIPGSILIYNFFTSAVTSSEQCNTRLTITNTHPNLGVYAHMIFIDSLDGGIVDHNSYLTPNRTVSILLSDFDPGTTGYIVTLAVDEMGFPVNFNHLVGEANVKIEAGRAFNLPALTVAALSGWTSPIEPDNVTAVIRFDGISYSQLPLALSINNFPGLSNVNETTVILNLLDGDLRSGVGVIGVIYGLVYNELAQEACFGITPNGCQHRFILSNNSPRTDPRYDLLITSKKTGWMKFWVDAGQAMTGAVVNYSTITDNNTARNQGHNLHAITLKDSATLITNVYPPG
ncbi:MAG: Ig domain-containing protein [Blastocatellia bacterium]